VPGQLPTARKLRCDAPWQEGEGDTLDHNCPRRGLMESNALVRSLVASVRFWLGFHDCGTSLLYRVPRSRSFRQAVFGRWGSSSTSPMLWSGCVHQASY
jgi:hypothetical protein